MDPKIWKIVIFIYPSAAERSTAVIHRGKSASGHELPFSLTLVSHQPLLVVSPCSAVIKLFLNGRERKKKKKPNNISSSKKPIDRQILWIPPSTAIFELRTS